MSLNGGNTDYTDKIGSNRIVLTTGESNSPVTEPSDLIPEIREIAKGKTMYAGLKPATASKGLIIKFGKYDEIYISPATNELFVSEILKRNPEIVVSK